jgi:hypothetical protein
MLAIEAASVVDGDVVGDNLILTKHDGTQINAGSVRGPKGDPGPVGSDLAVLSAIPVLDVGVANQIRAGRQLTAADFVNMGLNAPAGLWNLSDLTDVSGNGRNLSNKGAVGFASGINGSANTAAQFTGAVGQALYIPDTGAGDPFRLRTGSWGCWFKTAKRSTFNMLIDKYGTAGQQNFSLFVNNTNQLQCTGSPDGTSNVMLAIGTSDVADDRWHFGVITYDGALFRLYVDSALEGVYIGGPTLFPGGSVLNIGGRGADASNNAAFVNYGRVDEAFVTADVLSDDQIRNLYCARITHTLATLPTRISLRVRRRKRGSALASADFPVQPLRLHNFSAGSMADEGSNVVALTNNGAAPAESGVDGSGSNAIGLGGSQSLSSTDAGLPQAAATRSYGCWFKSPNTTGALLGWGAGSTSASGAQLAIGANGVLVAQSGSDQIIGPFVTDGAWHFVVVVEDNAPLDGVKRKLYLDGKLIGSSLTLNNIALGGANRMRIGAYPDASGPMTGQIDGAFISTSALTIAQIQTLYNKSSQGMAPSPKNAGDHIEALSATDILAVFDSLDAQHTIDLSVAA